MSCDTGCEKTFCWGEFNCSEEIILPDVGTVVEGVYAMQIERPHNTFTVSAEQVADSGELVFPNKMKETGITYFTILSPDLTPFQFTFEDVTYTRFSLINKIHTDITPAEVPAEEEFVPDCE